jgi:assimilatory nitrate reductase catalytic subunit
MRRNTMAWRRSSGRGQARLFGDGRFAHADGRARFVPTPPRAPRNAPDEDYPLILNTGRVRDQWHTMTRTGKAATLAGHIAESFIDLHPQDALLYGVREGELARISSAWGAMVARVRARRRHRARQVFVPIHWNDANASDARVGAVVNPVVDPVSGEPEFKHTPVRIEQFRVHWHGFILSRTAVNLDGVAHWTRIQGGQFLRYELAGRQRIADLGAWARALLGVADEQADWLEYADASAGVYRAVHLDEGRIAQCVYVSPRPTCRRAPGWPACLRTRRWTRPTAPVLLGQPIGKGADAGPTVCACFGVGRNTICAAIREQGLTTTAQVTACVKAGGNCGSCVPEIRQLLLEVRSVA